MLVFVSNNRNLPQLNRILNEESGIYCAGPTAAHTTRFLNQVFQFLTLECEFKFFSPDFLKMRGYFPPLSWSCFENKSILSEKFPFCSASVGGGVGALSIPSRRIDT